MNKITKTIAGVIATFALVAVFAASANAAYTRNLTVGSTGADVTELQTWLNLKGYLAVAPTGYFGNLTKAAVAAFQTANGITPAAGYFGPITQAKVMAMGGSMTGNFPAGCTSASGFSTTTGAPCNTGTSAGFPAGCTSAVGFSPLTGASCSGGSTPSTGGPLAGTDGTISDISELSQYSDEEVGEGEEDVKVAGFEIEASNEGDILLRSFKIEFDPAGNEAADSDHLDDYISGVKVWMGDTEIGSADVDDFNEEDDDTYTKTITLKSGTIVRADDTEKFYITVDGANSFDSEDIGSDSWEVDVLNTRFEDGSGVVTTDTTDTEYDDMDVEIDFVSFSDSADTELKFTTDTSTPEGVVIVSETSNTDDTVVLKGKVEVEGESDIVLDELPVTLTSTGSGLVGITSSLTLTIDGEDYSETVSSSTINTLAASGLTGSIVFDDLNITLEAGKTYSYSVSANINDIETGSLDEGATLLVSVTGTNVDYVDAENEEGDQLVDDTEKTGTSIGETQEFRTEGIAVTLVSTDAESFSVDSTDNDRVELTIKFKVEAFGEDAYIPSFMTPTTNATNATTGTGSSSTTPTTASGVAFHVQSSDTGLTIAALAGSTLSSTADEETNSFLVQEGGSGETFTLKVVVTNAGALDSASVRTLLAGVNFADTDSATGDYVYTLNLEDFKTDYATIAD